VTPAEWGIRLSLAAPGHRALGDMLARALASRPRQEELLLIGDVLSLWAGYARTYGQHADARDLAALAELVREHAGLLPARVWPRQA
jgi:hypothetical protein